MPDYGEELQRRIGQFAGYLKKMYHRAHEEVEGSCFIIFEERSPTDGFGDAALSEAAKPALELVVAGFDDAGITSVTMTDDVSFIELPDEGWKEDDSQARFVQFSIEKNWFCLDMPLQTLYRAEAEQILRLSEGVLLFAGSAPIHAQRGRCRWVRPIPKSLHLRRRGFRR